MTTTEIAASEISVNDYIIVSNPHRARFAIKVERLGGSYVVGKVFSIGTFARDSMVAFNGSRKVASLRPTTTIERLSV